MASALSAYETLWDDPAVDAGIARHRKADAMLQIEDAATVRPPGAC